jgi:hypothetical protein
MDFLKRGMKFVITIAVLWLSVMALLMAQHFGHNENTYFVSFILAYAIYGAHYLGRNHS